MRQLLLDLLPPPAAPSLDNYVPGRNQALITTIRQQQRQTAEPPVNNTGMTTAPMHYLWGSEGCGKTHLLKAIAGGTGGRYLQQTSPLSDFDYQAGGTYCIDDIDSFNSTQLDAIFALYQAMLTNPLGQLWVSGPCAPFQLTEYAPQMRADLRTRLGAMLVWQVHALSEGEMAEALQEAASQRGLQLQPGVIGWLLTHWERSMPALLTLLDALDRYSLERRRAAITLPLLKDLLAESQ
ncbi:HdaA/DnaA family protein [Parvibium lacunae]|uniref:DnaA regulatory inactivator Hda n=1 Tax=Parvibium lacunae TaxID=1888893 RepID=A0A368L1J8_9BURK|nr:DnaA regulatory inactivator Hda [Parvibium lacunae]RCS57353.1 DnaA regulatory inactivator Hda [Parvibium lacunae]